MASTTVRQKIEDNDDLVMIYITPDLGVTSPVEGCYNGKNFSVPRNVWVKVPKNIAEIIEYSNKVIRDMNQIPTDYNLTK